MNHNGKNRYEEDNVPPLYILSIDLTKHIQMYLSYYMNR